MDILAIFLFPFFVKIFTNILIDSLHESVIRATLKVKGNTGERLTWLERVLTEGTFNIEDTFEYSRDRRIINLKTRLAEEEIRQIAKRYTRTWKKQ